MDFLRKFLQFDRLVFPILSVLALSAFASFFIYRQFSSGPRFVARIVHRDIELVVNTLAKIDEQCSILSFDGDQNKLDFFTVKEFTGSEVGSLHLAHPQMWQGPYLHDNPQIQGKEYQFCKTREGLFVVPGDGVNLPNEYVVDGRALRDKFMGELTAKGGHLHFDGLSFAKKLPFRIGDWPAPGMVKAAKDIEEMAEALPFS